MTRRALFIAGAKTGPELRAGARDCEKIHSVLSDTRFGGFDPVLSAPLLTECGSASDYMAALLYFIDRSAAATHRMIYFTGHGRVQNGTYGIEFDGEYLPFPAVTGMFEGRGLARTLFILDTCHSGAAELGGVKSDGLPIEYGGSAIFASSRDVQLSHEDEEIGSAFTHYLCECIETGNGGEPTTRSLITVPDAIDFIQRRIAETNRAPQDPIYTVRNGDGPLWIAHNLSGATSSGALVSAESPDDPFAGPCHGATLDEIDGDLLASYAEDVLESRSLDLPTVARQLGLFPPGKEGHLSKAAILCFGRRPSHFFPSAASTFSAGDIAAPSFDRTHIDGPLVRQLTQLVQLTQKHLRTEARFGSGSDREDICEIPTLVLREVIGNALAHRDFTTSGRVQIHVDPDFVRISNPGSAPAGHSWSDLLDNPGFTYSPNRRLANLLQEVRGHEGIGRGFAVLQRFREERGGEAVTFDQRDNTVICTLRRPPATPPSAAMRGYEQQVAQFIAERANVLAYHKDLFTSVAKATTGLGSSSEGYTAIVGSLVTTLLLPGALVTLVGAAGSGKTHLLRRLFLRLTEESRQRQAAGKKDRKERVLVPIFAALRDLNADLPLRAGLAQAIGAEPSLIEYIFATQSPILILDGLDECVPEARFTIAHQLRQIRETYPKISILVSSRQMSDNLIDPREEAVQLTGLSEVEVRKIVETDLSEPLARRFLNSVWKKNNTLSSNPLLLRLAVHTFEQIADAPNNVDDLLAYAFETLWSRHDSAKGQYVRLRKSAITSDTAKRMLGVLALFYLGQELSTPPRDDVLHFLTRILDVDARERRGSPSVRPEDVLEDFLEVGIMVAIQDKIGYAHRAFLEYFALDAAMRLTLPGEDFAKVLLMLLARGIDVDRIIAAVGNWPALFTEHVSCETTLREKARAGDVDADKIEQLLAGMALTLSERTNGWSILSDLIGDQ